MVGKITIPACVGATNEYNTKDMRFLTDSPY